MALTCSAQAFLMLAVGELFFPSITGGQGSLSMWGQLWRYPFLWTNAINNSLYWFAFAYLLREPLGQVLTVLAFLAAVFLVEPISVIAGLPPVSVIPFHAILLALTGCCLCVVDVPPWLTAAAARNMPWLSAFTLAQAPSGSEATSPTQSPSKRDADGVAGATSPPPSPPAPAAADAALHMFTVGVAFLALALCTGVGVTITNVFQVQAGLNAFGYAAIDQVLLPVTTLPLAAVLDASPTLREALGEPRWSEAAVCPPSFRHSVSRAVAEVRPFWRSLLAFHSLEFVRTIAFYSVVTTYDTSLSYFSLTLTRVLLSWLATLAAMTVLRTWVGLDAAAAAAATHPVALSLRIGGSLCLAVAVWSAQPS
jgi:hypothetical protein